MKRMFVLSILAGAALLLGVGSAEAQSCFDCVQQSGSNQNRPSLYCTGGYDFGACTTDTNYDPNTCETYTTCNNVYSCMPWQDPGATCTNSTCDPNQRWDINTFDDLYGYTCYHFGTMCGFSPYFH